MPRINFAMIVAMIACFTLPTNVQGAAGDVFTKLEGKYRGTGTSIVGSRKKVIRVTCQLTNTYERKSAKLRMKGKCASSQGSRKINGAISHAGSKITGTFISLRSSVRITKTSGKITDKSVSVYTSFVDNDSGQLGKIFQTIQLTKSGFQANFFTFDKTAKKYQPVGGIAFKRK